MTTAIYLAAADPRAGKSLAAIGLLEALRRRSDRIGYFRPVALEPDDHRLTLAGQRYGAECRHALTDQEADAMLAAGDEEALYRRTIAAYRELAQDCDAVLIEGTDQSGTRSALEFDFNARLANNLGARMVAVVSGEGRTVEDLVEAARVTVTALEEEKVAVAALLVNRVAPAAVDAVTERIADLDVPTSVVPEDPLLSMPTVAEVLAALQATEVHPGSGNLERPVGSFAVAAMSLPNMLDRLRDDELILVPGDRPDVLVGALASRLADTYADVAGVVLTGGIDPPPQVLRLMEGLGGVPVPVHATDHDTFEAAQIVSQVRSVITADSDRKIATALGLFADHVDVGELLDRVEVAMPGRTTPLMFEYELLERARADRRHIVLPEGTDERILKASVLLRRRGVADLTLLGDPAEVRRQASALDVDLTDVPIVDPNTDDRREAFAKAYVEARAHKGMVLDRAMEVMGDVSYFGTMMVHLGHADGMVSGAAHTTAHTIRPSFEFVGTKPGVDSVSSVFLMCLADRVLVYGDCAIIPNPTAEQLADIAVSSAETARTFGVDPVVAMLSYSTGTSGAGQDVERVRAATEMVRERAPELQVEGPIQYDAAIDAGVGAKKLPDSPVAGRATVFVFPDLNTGNNTYKAVQRSSGAVAIGPVLQGLVKPVNDLSRGCTVNDVLNTVAITAIQAQLADAEGSR